MSAALHNDRYRPSPPWTSSVAVATSSSNQTVLPAALGSTPHRVASPSTRSIPLPLGVSGSWSNTAGTSQLVSSTSTRSTPAEVDTRIVIADPTWSTTLATNSV